ncbi:MAG: glycosyltransferase family 39 protein [Firmicutes bacterium]|nr:glycosyltransferase family 39 protein [Bacillota bacterium]
MAVFLFLLVWLHHLGTPSIWFDEAFSYWTSSETPGKILEVIKGEPHPPFYFFFLHFWLKLGSSEFLMRLPSVFFGFLTLTGLYLLAAYLFDRRAALISSFLYSLNFMAFYSGTEARMYAPFSAFVILSFYFFARLLKEGKKTDAIGYTFFITLSLYTHYFGFFVLLSQAIAFIAAGLPRKRIIAVSWLCSIMLFSPWLFFMMGQARGGIGSLMPSPNIHVLGNTLKIFSGLGAFIGNGYPGILVLRAAELVFLFLLGAGFYFMLIKGDKGNFYLLSTYVLIPLVLSFGIAVFTHLHIYSERYLFFLSPALCIIIGSGVSLMAAGKEKIPAILAVSAFFIFNGISFYNYNTDPIFWRQDWRSCAMYIEKSSQPGDAILFNPPYCQLPFNFYYKGRAAKIQFTEKKVFKIDYKHDYFKDGGLEQFGLTGIDEAFLKKIAGNNKRIWFITSQSFLYDPEKKIGKWLVENGEVIIRKSVKFETSEATGDIYVWLVKMKR